MRIGIHKNTMGFADRWIDYCKSHNIDYKVVNAYGSDIIEQLNDCDIFMWHHYQASYKDVLFAKQLLFALQQAGKKVFPDFSTGWHFDDKVGQKYLLEAEDAPIVPSYVFYTRKEALNWANETNFPKVFKLRGGAGSSNVMLATTRNKAKKYINRSFGRGFSQYNSIANLKDRWVHYKMGKSDIMDVIKGIARIVIKPAFSRMHAPEKGYAYFQDFIPNNKYDIRIVIIGNKAFALKRLVRKGDFRASGSGNIIYDKNQIDERCVKISFEVNERLKAQSIAYDFVFDNDKPLITEISYGYAAAAYDNCVGYWTDDMQWHEGNKFDFCGWMIENLISK